MSPDLDRLIKLQHLDTRIEEARRTIASHPERLAAADTRLNEAKHAVDAAKQRLKDSQDARRALEKDAAVYQGRLTKFKDQLSAVKTNREYQAMQHEIATAQQELGTAEIKQAEAVLATQQKEADAEKKALASELAETEQSLARNTAARAALIAEMPKPIHALYDQVSRARKGVAISMATRDGLCSVCHVRLRPPVFQQVRQNDTIVQCEVCQRILYYIPPPPLATPATIINP
jgi:predicted  nucleic acid-binding Zn-ribbon protein